MREREYEITKDRKATDEGLAEKLASATIAAAPRTKLLRDLTDDFPPYAQLTQLFCGGVTNRSMQLIADGAARLEMSDGAYLLGGWMKWSKSQKNSSSRRNELSIMYTCELKSLGQAGEAATDRERPIFEAKFISGRSK